LKTCFEDSSAIISNAVALKDNCSNLKKATVDQRDLSCSLKELSLEIKELARFVNYGGFETLTRVEIRLQKAIDLVDPRHKLEDLKNMAGSTASLK
jgi:hypothetical protein